MPKVLPVSSAHCNLHTALGGEVVIFLMAGAAECPYAFAHFWARKWFRVFWWIAIAMTIVGLLCPAT
jgi:hypothetical protein